jgi:hypothetical protein
MNKFEPMITNHWKTHLPHAWSQLSDEQAQAMVAASASELEAEIQTLAASIAGPDQPGETYQQKVGRLTMARRDAESDLISEFLPQPETQTSDEDLQDTEREMSWLQSTSQWRSDELQAQAEQTVLDREDLSAEQRQQEIERELAFLTEQDTLRAARQETLARSRT